MSSHVIVFGGSSGIGEAAARSFATAGSRVTIVGRDTQKLSAALARLSHGVTAKAVDAMDRGAVDALFVELGPFDHLVLSISGGKGGGPFRKLALDDLRSGLEHKLLAQLSVAQASLATIAEAGSITFVSSGSARMAIPSTTGLAAINAALEAAVRTLALELAPIRVNAVSPGIIDTPWWDAAPPSLKTGAFAQAAASLPVRRVGRPEDVAAAITMVATNGFMTGTVIPVDGGAPFAR
jgi:NAD(P)-dependent dehydrogenase (short-subunit alcohol dehydrogenase family)